jgi:hypothetical protein
MFGKLLQKTKKFLGKSLHQLDTGSKFIGKLTHNIKDGYKQGKKFVLSSADKVDKTLGLEGATKALAQTAIGALESNPYAAAASLGLKEVDVANKLLRHNVINNSQLKSFVGS